MKRWTLLVCMLAMLIFSVAATAISGGPTTAKECKDSGYLPASICEACFNGGSGDKAVCVCKETNNFGGEFKNQGECVSYLKNNPI